MALPPSPPTPAPEVVIHAGTKISLSLLALMVAQLATRGMGYLFLLDRAKGNGETNWGELYIYC